MTDRGEDPAWGPGERPATARDGGSETTDGGGPATADGERAVAAPDGSRLARFLGVLVALAAAVVAVGHASGVGVIPLAGVYMFTPMVAGAVVVVTSEATFPAVGLRIGRPRWLAAAALGVLPLVLATLALSVAVPGIGFDPGADPISGVSLPSGLAGLVAALAVSLVAGCTINAVLAFGEEFGWRGYLLWELAPLGFWKASLAIGTLWGLWHAPVIVEGYNYASFPLLGVLVMTAATVAFSPVYTYLVVRARSVFAAVFFHGVFNAAAGLVVVYATTSDDVLGQLVANPVGAAGIAVFALAALAIALTGAPPLDRSFAAGDDRQGRS